MVAGSREQLQLDVAGDVVLTDRPPRPITIAAAIPKGDRLDWMVQKLTELGADRLVLLHAEHSTTRWDDARAAAQRERLRSGCRSRRAGRAAAPGRCASKVRCRRSRSCRTAWSPSRAGGRSHHPTTPIAIGPEGGWSDAELAAARGNVSLGANILRVETAAIAALTVRVSFDS